jgi:hypothetical protein
VNWLTTSSSGAPRRGYGAGFPVMAPPPLWGPPPPLRPGSGSAVGAVAGTWTPGPPGANGVGDGGFGIGAALTGPAPNVSADRPTPAAIAAALAKRLRSIIFIPSEAVRLQPTDGDLPS